MTENSCKSVIDGQDYSMSSGKLHYVKVFATFFPLVSTFAFFRINGIRDNSVLPFYVILYVLGLLSAVLVAPRPFFGFLWRLSAGLGTFGFTFFIFPLNLATGLGFLALGILLSLAVLLICPAVFTLYHYFTDLKQESTSLKKELTALMAGLAAAVLLIGAFYGTDKLVSAVKFPHLKGSLNPAAVYAQWSEDSPGAVPMTAQQLSEPVSSVFNSDELTCENVYETVVKKGVADFKTRMAVNFIYSDKSWKVRDTREDFEYAGIEPVTGVWEGIDGFYGNFCHDNQYTLTLDNFTQDGGTGTFHIYREGEVDELRSFTVKVNELQDTDSYQNKSDCSVKLDISLLLDNPVTYSTFGGDDSFSEIKCTYDLVENTICTDTPTLGLQLMPRQSL